MKLIALTILLAIVSLPAFGQSSSDARWSSFVAAGASLGTTNASLAPSSTVGGGFVEGQYQFLRLFQFNGLMSVDNQARYIPSDTVVGLKPEMRILVPLNASGKTKLILGGGVDMQVGPFDPAINPITTFGVLYDEKYAARFSYLFDDMNNGGSGQAFRGYRIGVDILHPLSEHLALRVGFDFDRQMSIPLVPASQIKARVGLAFR